MVVVKYDWRGGSAKSTRNISFCLIVVRLHKDGIGYIVLYEFPKVKECSAIGDSCRLLHVMRYNYDGVIFLELVDELLDFRCRNWVEGGTGLVH